MDIGTVNDRSVCTVTHTNDGEVFLDKMVVWEGNHANPVDLQDVENVVGQEAHAYNRAKIVFDPPQAVHIVGRLQDKGHKTQPHTFSATSNHSLAVGLHQSIRHEQLHLYEPGGLLDELAHVRLVETPAQGIGSTTHPAGTTTGLSRWVWPSTSGPCNVGYAGPTKRWDMG